MAGLNVKNIRLLTDDAYGTASIMVATGTTPVVGRGLTFAGTISAQAAGVVQYLSNDSRIATIVTAGVGVHECAPNVTINVGDVLGYTATGLVAPVGNAAVPSGGITAGRAKDAVTAVSNNGTVPHYVRVEAGAVSVKA